MVIGRIKHAWLWAYTDILRVGHVLFVPTAGKKLGLITEKINWVFQVSLQRFSSLVQTLFLARLWGALLFVQREDSIVKMERIYVIKCKKTRFFREMFSNRSRGTVWFLAESRRRVYDCILGNPLWIPPKYCLSCLLRIAVLSKHFVCEYFYRCLLVDFIIHGYSLFKVWNVTRLRMRDCDTPSTNRLDL